MSDGECEVSDEVVYDLCRSAVKAGYVSSVIFYQSHILQSLRSALSFHAVSFGLDTQSTTLRHMVQIATEVRDAALPGPLVPPCSYSEALDTVRRSN